MRIDSSKIYLHYILKGSRNPHRTQLAAILPITSRTYEEGPCTDHGVTQGVERCKVELNVFDLACRSEEFSQPERLDDLLREKVTSDEVGPAKLRVSRVHPWLATPSSYIGEKQPGFRSLTTFMSGLDKAMAHCWTTKSYKKVLVVITFAVESETPMLSDMW
jgi:hypothetical protein